jgi:hypothetical protein
MRGLGRLTIVKPDSMWRVIMRVVAIGTLLTASALFAGAAVAGPAQPPKDPGSKVVCKSESTVGTHIPQRICRTRAEWDQMRTDARELIIDTTGKATGNNPFATPPPTAGPN